MGTYTNSPVLRCPILFAAKTTTPHSLLVSMEAASGQYRKVPPTCFQIQNYSKTNTTLLTESWDIVLSTAKICATVKKK